jgi:hypothetical protein
MGILDRDASFEANLEILLAHIGDSDLADVIRRHAARIAGLGHGSTAAERAPIMEDVRGWISDRIEARRSATAAGLDTAEKVLS